MSKHYAYYQKALELVASEMDWKGVCIAMAKENPKLFCECVGKLPWQVTAKDILIAEGKVPAIKYVRGETGFGLKEAKDAVEAL